MPVIRTAEKHLDRNNRPEWCNVTSAGIFRVGTEDGYADCHYHDCNEYWLIFKGKAKIQSEGKEYYIMAGDIVCIKAGDEHHVLEVYEDLEGFWFEEVMPPGGGVGHLHRDPEKAKGHPVPCTSSACRFSHQPGVSHSMAAPAIDKSIYEEVK